MILRRLGSGYFTEDALGAEPGPTGVTRLVLIKSLLPRLHDARPFVGAWLARATAAIALRHDGIARVFAAEPQGGGARVVTEYVGGETLRLLVSALAARELSLPLGSACRIVAQAAESLAYAHALPDSADDRRSLLHGDLSPENVVVTYAGQTKLIDFGLGRADPLRKHTPPSRLASRIAHQAPEQLQQRTVDRRADVWGLGVLLYELLAGRLLFHGATPQEVLEAVMGAPVPPPSRYNPAIPPELDAVVLDALERDVPRRISSAAALRERLEQVLEQSEGAHPAALGGWLRGALRDCYAERQSIEREARTEAIEALRAQGPPPWATDAPVLIGAHPRSAWARARSRAWVTFRRRPILVSALLLVPGASGLLSYRLGRHLGAGEHVPWRLWPLVALLVAGGTLLVAWRLGAKRWRTSPAPVAKEPLSSAEREAAAWRNEAQHRRKRLTEAERALSRVDGHLADAMDQLVEAEERASQAERLERALGEAHAELRQLRDLAERTGASRDAAATAKDRASR
ncbi:MAG: protein kinase [Proteobacteria bacterium]|nr:protein kinase [Pseudomonadota bacterium]